jgi:hypothetical protein
MAPRLAGKKARGRYGWWKYAAAVLLLAGGASGLYYYRSPLIPGPAAVPVATVKIPPAPSSKITLKSRDTQRIKKTAHPAGEKPFKVIKDRRRSTAGIKKAARENKPDPARTEATGPVPKARPDPEGMPKSFVSAPPVKKEPEQLPVVYYNEITESRNKTAAGPPAAPGLSVSVNSLRPAPPVLYAGEQPFTPPLSIHLSPKR